MQTERRDCYSAFRSMRLCLNQLVMRILYVREQRAAIFRRASLQGGAGIGRINDNNSLGYGTADASCAKIRGACLSLFLCGFCTAKVSLCGKSSFDRSSASTMDRPPSKHTVPTHPSNLHSNQPGLRILI